MTLLSSVARHSSMISSPRDPGHDPRQAGANEPRRARVVRMNPYYTERMLARSESLARIGAIASMTHERCDGLGYHRGLTAQAIPATGRLLAAACAFQAMTEPRPYRLARTAKHAVAELRRRPGGSSRQRRRRRCPVGRRAAAGQTPHGCGGAHPSGDRGARAHRARRVSAPRRSRVVDQTEDRRDPHRADLREDRRDDTVDRHPVRLAARPARRSRAALICREISPTTATAGVVPSGP